MIEERLVIGHWSHREILVVEHFVEPFSARVEDPGERRIARLARSQTQMEPVGLEKSPQAADILGREGSVLDQQVSCHQAAELIGIRKWDELSGDQGVLRRSRNPTPLERFAYDQRQAGNDGSGQ